MGNLRPYCRRLQEALNDNLTDDERPHLNAEITFVPYEIDTERVALVRFRSGVP
jgi:hypothetical protein